jgi:hypothetical protein
MGWWIKLHDKEEHIELLGFWTLSIVQKSSNSECHTSSSEPFRICLEDEPYRTSIVTTNQLAKNKLDAVCNARVV